MKKLSVHSRGEDSKESFVWVEALRPSQQFRYVGTDIKESNIPMQKQQKYSQTRVMQPYKNKKNAKLFRQVVAYCCM